MEKLDRLLVFALADQLYGVHLDEVERVVRAVEVAQLPDAPECIIGVINMKGRIIPAVDLRKRFLLPEKELHPADRFIIATTPRRTFALLADAVHGVAECVAEAVVPSAEILPRMGPFEGVMVLPDGVVLISDIDKFLSLEEEAALDALLKDPASVAACGGEAP